MKKWKAAALAGIGAVMLAGAGFAAAQAYPAKPISIILPFPPGSGNDTVARIIGPKITAELNQPVVVDNRPQPARCPPPRADSAPLRSSHR